jgi:hypothetical protein
LSQSPTLQLPWNTNEPFADWRKKLLGLPAEPTEEGPFDLVVVGGGYAGMGAAISAARMGCNVALIQNRPVLGGNGSSEVQVWANGLIRRGRFPRIGEIIQEFEDNATSSPGTKEMYGDAKKEAVVRAEDKIAMFLNHHGYKVETEANGNEIFLKAVWAFDTRTGQQRRFTGKLFCDATGHATIGALAGAKSEMTMEKHMGMSNMWTWRMADKPTDFPETPWALDLNMKDFPYPRFDARKNFGHAQWFWETGFDKHPIDDLEYMRDWNLRASYGAFNAMKNRDGADKHRNAELTWLAYIGGPRESRRLIGDVVLTSDDIVNKVDFKDGCVASTWSIDLHYPKQEYMKKYPDDPFISKAVFDKRVDKNYGYPVPYRCFYSVNVPNLFMAGRNISVTHEALGTVRVMKTLGMVGEVVGKATSVCVKHDCLPRDIYSEHLPELFELLRQPGRARRDTPTGEIRIEGPPVAPPWSRSGGHQGIAVDKLTGVVVDDTAAKTAGKWSSGTGLPDFVGSHYLYTGPGDSSIRFEFKTPKDGKYEVRLWYTPHSNRATNVPVTVESAGEPVTKRINQKDAHPSGAKSTSLGVFEFQAGGTGSVTVTAAGTDGNVCADAVQLLPQD